MENEEESRFSPTAVLMMLLAGALAVCILILVIISWYGG